MGLWGAADSRGRPQMSEGRFGIRYPWRSTSSCCGGCRCSTMEILMRGVCIICAYTGVNYTLPTSVVELYSRGCYDNKYIPPPGRPTRCDIIYNSRLYYHAPARGRFGSTVPRGTKDCATWVALPPAPCSLSPILISYSTLYSYSVLCYRIEIEWSPRRDSLTTKHGACRLRARH